MIISLELLAGMMLRRHLYEFLLEPKVGKDVVKYLNEDTFNVWRTVYKDDKIVKRSIAEYYLRLDKSLESMARLSPSIEREFITYTVLGLNREKVEKEAENLRLKIREISERKFRLARDLFKNYRFKDEFLAIIGGDVALNMAHDEPRVCKFYSKLVNGSDLDVVVIFSDDVDEEIVKDIERDLLNKKIFYLKVYREELDLKIKRFSDIMEDMNFDTFERKVACKILYESKFLDGNIDMFLEMKRELEKRGIVKFFEKLKTEAFKERMLAIKDLLENGRNSKYYKLFESVEEFHDLF